MKNKKTYMAILLGLLVGAGSTVLADSVIFEPSDDTFVNIFTPDANADAFNIMRIRHQADGWGLIHPLVKFDLASLPALGAGESFQINYARFAFWGELTSDDGSWAGGNSFPELSMYYNMGDWSEDTVTWNTAPAYDTVNVVTTLNHIDRSPNPDDVFTAPDTVDTSGWLFFDDGLAATVVHYWANGLFPNYGVRIEGTGEDYTDSSRYLDIFTEEHPNETAYEMGPYLYVDYDIIPEPATLSLFGVFGIAFWAFRKKFSI